MKQNKQETYSWIWYQDDFKTEPPIVRLMKKEDRPKRIWVLNKSNGGIK